MKLIPQTTVSDLLKIAPDGAHFRPVRREDLIAGSPIFQVSLARSTMEALEAGKLEAGSARAFLPILLGWATVRAQVMETITETSHSVQLMDQVPKVRSGRYPVAIDHLTSPVVFLLTEGKIAYTYFVSPIEVACPICGEQIKFWPTEPIERHLEERHRGSPLRVRDLMPWRRKPPLATPA